MSNAVKIRNVTTCPFCFGTDVSTTKRNGMWHTECHYCGMFSEVPAEDEVSDIVEPGQLTKEEAIGVWENHVNDIYLEG